MPANTSLMPDGEYRPVCECVWLQMHSRLGVDAGVSGSRDERVWEQRRMRLGAEALTGIGNGGAKHNRSLGRQSEGRIMQRSLRHQHHCVLRDISVLFHFA